MARLSIVDAMQLDYALNYDKYVITACKLAILAACRQIKKDKL